MYPATLERIGDRIRKRRLDLGMLQKNVAQRIGASVASLWLWENKRGDPELKWLPDILEFLATTPDPKHKQSLRSW